MGFLEFSHLRINPRPPSLLSRLISLTANETSKAEAAELERILSAALRRGGETL